MTSLSPMMLFALAITSGITITAMLGVFANIIGHETQLHDLRNGVQDLQFKRAVFEARVSGQIPAESKKPHEAIELPPLESSLASDPNAQANLEPDIELGIPADEPQEAQLAA